MPVNRSVMSRYSSTLNEKKLFIDNDLERSTMFEQAGASPIYDVDEHFRPEAKEGNTVADFARRGVTGSIVGTEWLIDKTKWFGNPLAWGMSRNKKFQEEFQQFRDAAEMEDDHFMTKAKSRARGFIGGIASEMAVEALATPITGALGVARAAIQRGGSVPFRRMRGFMRKLGGGSGAAFNEGALIDASYDFSSGAARDYAQKTVGELYEKSQNRIAGKMFEAKQLREGISSALVDYEKAGGNIADGARLLSAARIMGPDGLRHVPEQLKESFTAATGFLDDTSKYLVEQGGMSTKDAQTVLGNLGKYLHTSHAKFDTDEFAKMVWETAEPDKAFAYLKTVMPDASDDDISGVIAHIIQDKGGNGFGFLRGNGAPKVMMKKGDIHPVIRGLMGVHDDFAVNFDKSAAGIIQAAEHARFRREMLTEGVRSGALTKKPVRVNAANVRGEHAGDRVIELTGAKLAEKFGVVGDRFDDFARQGGDESHTFYNLLGGGDEAVFTTQSFVDALDLAGTEQRMARGGLLPTVNGLIKYGKTVLSPVTQLRNFFSGSMMLTQSGLMLDPLSAKNLGVAMKSSGKTIAGNLKKGVVDDWTRGRIQKAHELGLVGAGALTGDMKVYAKQIADGLFDGGTKATKGLGGKILQGAQDAYQAGDDFWRLAAWEQQITKLDSIIKTDADRSMLKWMTGTDVVEDAAGEMVKNTIQNFNRVSPYGKKLSRNPFFGTFSSFQMEMPRNLAKNFQYAVMEAYAAKQTGNAKWAVSAMTRVGGMFASLSIPAAAATYTYGHFGIDDRVKLALDRLNPIPWDQKDAKVYIGKEEGGSWTYMNPGTFSPYGGIEEMRNALFADYGDEGPDLFDRLVRGGEVMGDMIFGEEMIMGPLVTVLANTQASSSNMLQKVGLSEGDGRRVYNPEDPFATKLGDIGYSIFRDIAPGALTSADNVINAATDGRRMMGVLGKDVYRSEKSLGAELRNLTSAPRTISIDYSKSYRSRIKAFRDRKLNLDSGFRKALESAVTAEDKRAVHTSYEGRWRELFDDAALNTEDAEYAGVPRAKVAELLGSQIGLRKDIKDALLSGGYVKWSQVAPKQKSAAVSFF